jgi:hypothetical protein
VRNRALVVAAVLAVAVLAWWLIQGSAPEGPVAPPARPPAPSPAVSPPDKPPPPKEEPKPAAEAPAPVAMTPSIAPAAAGGVAVKGRVVDDRRFPIGGARVTLVRSAQPPLSAIASADGGFRFEGIERSAPAYLPFGLVARAPDGRLGIQQSFVPPKGGPEVDAGAVVVGVSSPLAVRVLDGGASVPGARVAVGWGWSWPFDAVAGADGVARFEALPKQAVSLFAVAESPARAGRAEVALQGNPPQPVDLALAPARTVEVTVVEKGTEKPIPGATFKVRLQRRSPGMVMESDPGPLPPAAPTDADGRTRIEGTCATDWLSLDEAKAPGYFPSGFRQRAAVKPGDAQVRIELVGSRSLRFPVVPGEAPVPPDGAAIVLSAAPGTGAPDPVGGARMEGTELVVESATAGYYNAVAAAPDGSRAQLWADDKGTPPKEVSFRPARTIEILARKAEGTPAAGVAFALRNQGNNPIGDPKSTGDDGRVVFDGLYGQLTEVYMLDDPAQPWGGRSVGSVDLAKEGGSLEVVIPAKRAFVARVTVDGSARLVPQMYVNLGGASVSRFEEDPAKGEIRFEAVVDPSTKSITATLNALPYLPATVNVGPLPEGDPIPLEFALRNGGVLLVEVKTPKDVLGYRLNLQRWDDTKSMWISANVPGAMMGPGLSPGPDGVARAEPLVEGKYRVVESSTGVSTEAVEVRSGGEPARLSIDVSRQGYAKGKVQIPEGAKMADVRILVKGAGLEAKPPTGGFDNPAPRPMPDGTFMVRVPGDRPVTLVPWHPTLVPAAEGGTAEVTEPREDLVLRLVPGARATFRFSPAPKLPQWSDSKPRVLLYAGSPSGDPASEHAAVAEGEAHAFGGFPAGTWTLWIDPVADYAPAVVRGAALGEKDTDLGTVALSEGSRVRVKILVKEGTAVPRIYVWANREEAPKYGRGINSNGEDTVVVGGFGPGRFRITTSVNMGSPGMKSINEVRELDGTNDLELTLDLR